MMKTHSIKEASGWLSRDAPIIHGLSKQQKEHLDGLCDYLGYEITAFTFGWDALIIKCPAQNVVLRLNTADEYSLADLPFTWLPVALFGLNSKAPVEKQILLEVLPLAPHLYPKSYADSDETELAANITQRTKAIEKLYEDLFEIHSDANILHSGFEDLSVLENWTHIATKSGDIFYILDAKVLDFEGYGSLGNNLWQASKMKSPTVQHDRAVLRAAYAEILGQDPLQYALDIRRRVEVHECRGLTYLGPHRLFGKDMLAIQQRQQRRIGDRHQQAHKVAREFTL